MKKKFIFLTMLLLTLLGGVKWNVLNAQETTTVEIGEGSTTYDSRTPVSFYYASYAYSSSQQIYYKDELDGISGSITHISFRKQRGNNNARNLVVYIENTTKESFETKTDWVKITSEPVFYGSVNFGTGDNAWITIELDEPFVYDGNSNILLSVHDITGEKPNSSNWDKFYIYPTGTNRTLYCNHSSRQLNPQTGTEINGEDIATYSYLFTNNNQIRFTFVAGGDDTPVTPSTPTSLTATAIDYCSIALTWDAAENAKRYNVYNGENIVKTVSETSCTIDGLDSEKTYTYTVTAVNGSEESGHSNEASATTLAMPKLCNIVFTLKDTWGDGWNGNKLIVKYGSTTKELTLLEGKEGTYTLGIPEGSVVNMEYKGPNYPAENSFEVKYESSGDLIWSKTASYGDPLHNGGKHTFTIPVFKPTIEASVLEIALGTVRMGNYWTEKPVSETFNVVAKNTTVTSVTCDNTFFEVDYESGVVTVSYDNTVDVSGEQTGTITIAAEGASATVAVSATAYTPAQGDVWELAKEISLENGYTEDVTGMYDDYILPGEAEEGNAGDAVYKFTLENEGVITASVTGTNGNVAIYKADSISSKRGPSLDNNYNGIVSGSTAPTTFFYDFNDEDLSDFVYSNWKYWDGYVYTSTEGAYIMTKEQYLVTNNSIFSFDIWANDYQYSGSEKYVVFVSEDDVFGNADDIRIKEGNCGNKENINIELSAYSGGKYHFGFFFEKKNFMFSIDNLQLTDSSAKSRTRGAQIENQYPAGTYYLVAAAEGDFTLNLSTSSLPAPAEFAYTAPENNKIAKQTNPELTWESAEFASNYDVYLGTTSTLTESDLKGSVSTTSYKTTGLSNNTKYYWQVVAKNSIGETEGATWSFVTPLDIPENVTASSNEIYPENNTVTISWNEIKAAKGYNVYIKFNGQGEGIAHNNNTLITESSYQIDNMDYSSNGHIIYVTAVYEIDGVKYESEVSETETVKVTDYITVSGKVTDGTNVIAGATVVATGTDEFGKAQNYGPVTTKNDGTYTFNVLVGEYTFTASKFDYKDKTTETLVLDYTALTLNITLESNPVAEFEVNVEENGDNANVSWKADYTSYNVYRRDSEGNVTKLTQETIAEKQYSDNWSSLPNGEYEYGVSAMVAETQNVTETFSTTSIPEGWTQNGTYTWNFNGATAYLYVFTSTSSQSNLISPMIDLTGIASPKVTFKYCTYSSSGSGYSNTITVSVAESLDGTWKQVWTNNKKFTGYNTYENAEADLSNYSGKKVYVKFSSNINYCYSYIDDVVLPNSTTSESKVNWAAPIEKGGIAFTGEGNWNDKANWSAVPNTEDKVTIKGNATITEDVTVGSIRIASGATLTVKSGAVLNVTNGISNKNAEALVMEDGAQIVQPNANVAATFNMDIANPTKGWGEGSNNKDGWQFISSPLMNASTSAFETSGENNDFDLYKYDGTKDLEWINYKDHQLEGDTFFYNFSDGMQGWTTINANNDSYKWGHTEDGTGNNFTYGAPNGYNNEKGCLFSDAIWYNSSTWQPQYINPDDYVVSPERVMIVEGSKLSFYIQSATYNYTSGEITVLVSESETASADSFEQIYSVNEAYKGEWLKMTVSLAEYAGKEVWIAIRHKINNTQNSYILIDNLELTDGKTRSGNKDLFETEFVNGRGYLASYQAATTAKFVGTLNNATRHEYEVSYAGTEKELANFHLLGNPFPFNMDWNKVQDKGLVEGYAVVNGDGGYDYLTTGTINVGDGFFVQAIAENPSLYYNHNVRGSRQDANSINVIATSKAGKDNVVINFAGQKEGFNKLQNFNDEIATVFVANNGKRYGIANVEENVAEVELSFVASQMGHYSISLDVNGEFETVTLVDRFTGIETNMLLEDEYNFTATSNDSQNRFVVRLVNRQQTTDNSQFVYQSGEELILSIEGTVQIVDMLGRVVYSNEHSNGSNRISVAEFNNAAYVVRVVNEEGVKSQKVVIY